jgi:hypothetical protein
MMSDNFVSFTAVSYWEELIDTWPNGFAVDADNWPTFCGERIEINVLRYLSDRSRCKIDPVYREFGFTGDPADLVSLEDTEYEDCRPPH